MIEKIQATGGIMTLEDLAGYEVKVRRALEGSYRGRKIYVPHAPTSGGVLLHMFNLVEGYKEENWMEEGRTGLNVHRMLEAMKCRCCFLICSRLRGWADRSTGSRFRS